MANAPPLASARRIGRCQSFMARRMHPAPAPVTLPVLPIVGRARGQLASPVDGRYGPLDPGELQPAIASLARDADLRGVDYVLGIPEGGCIPAYAFAVETGLRVVLASIWRPDVPAVVSFTEEHDLPVIAGKHIHGLVAGDHVIVVEDEVTSGRTIVNCVRALRAAGIRCDQVATIYAADDPAMRARVVAEGIRLHVVRLYQPDTGERWHRP
jgi:adenine/guanine phosphoribosyltransferase-like PRPP-binding protein